jgi:glycosyltransferase involved in cell wall biosynthesis
MECLLVDDCGSDDSMAIVERMISEYNGPIIFLILHHEYNRGLSAARNTGTNASKGDFVFYLDSDDELTADCVEKLANPVIKDITIEMVMGNRIVRSDYYRIPKQFQYGIKLKEEDIISLDAVRRFFLNRKLLNVTAWNKLVKRNFLIRNQLYFKEGLIHEDILWTFFVVKHLSHLYTIPDITYIQHKRPNSITTGTDQEEELHHKIIVYEEIANNLSADDKKREAKYYLKQVCAICIKIPKSEALRAIAHKLMVDTGDNYSFEKFLYYVTFIFSRFSLGRSLLLFALQIRNIIREMV